MATAVLPLTRVTEILDQLNRYEAVHALHDPVLCHCDVSWAIITYLPELDVDATWMAEGNARDLYEFVLADGTVIRYVTDYLTEMGEVGHWQVKL